MADDATKVVGLSPLTVGIIAVICAATVLLIYHFIVSRLCNSAPEEPTPRHPGPTLAHEQDLESMSMETSIAELLPSYKYSKDIGLVSKTQDVTCAVCLCEFVEDEEVRVLPECLHPFHAPCIDMWLYSHANCPLCRTDTPNRQLLDRRSDPRPVGGDSSVTGEVR